MSGDQRCERRKAQDQVNHVSSMLGRADLRYEELRDADGDAEQRVEPEHERGSQSRTEPKPS
jgi:hypothetical protein